MMKSGKKLLLATLCVALLAIGYFAFRPRDCARIGREQAIRDIAENRLFIRTGGYPAPGFQEAVEIFEAKYGITLRYCHTCDVTSEILAEKQAYNEVMIQAIERRHGPGAYERINRDVDEEVSKRLRRRGAVIVLPVGHDFNLPLYATR